MQRTLPLIALVFAIALFFLYVRPTYSGPISTTRSQISSYDDALAAAQRFQQKEAELTQQRAQIPADSLARLSEFLPDGVDNVQLILDLDALAARSGVTLSDFSTQGSTAGSNTSNSTPATAATPSPDSTDGSVPTLGQANLGANAPVDSLELTFKATGTYAAVRSFLAGIENSLRPLDVTDLQVSQSDTGVYSYAMTVRIYWLR
jgi:hypothetical protein